MPITELTGQSRPHPTWRETNGWRALILLGVAVMVSALTWMTSRRSSDLLAPGIGPLLVLAAGGVIVLVGLELRRRSTAPAWPSPVTLALLGGLTLLHLYLAFPFDADDEGRGSAPIVRLTGCEGNNGAEGPAWLLVTELVGLACLPLGVVLIIVGVVQWVRSDARGAGRPALIVGATMVLAGFVTFVLIVQEATTTLCD